MRSESIAHVVAARAVHRAIRGRRAPVRKAIRPQVPPRALAQSYAKALLTLVHHVREVTTAALSPNLVEWVRESDVLHGRSDGAAGDAKKIFESLQVRFQGGRFFAGNLKPITDVAAVRISENQRAQLLKQLSVAVGVSIPIHDKDLGGKIDAFTQENVGLIQSLPQNTLSQVQQVLLGGLARGDRAESIGENIADRFDVSESRAALIARDQTLKFYAGLNEVRQRNLGITSFVWRTADDERTCSICGPLDGKKYTWEDAPEGGPGNIHPNCRCSAEPDLDALLDEL